VRSRRRCRDPSRTATLDPPITAARTHSSRQCSLSIDRRDEREDERERPLPVVAGERTDLDYEEAHDERHECEEAADPRLDEHPEICVVRGRRHGDVRGIGTRVLARDLGIELRLARRVDRARTGPKRSVAEHLRRSPPFACTNPPAEIAPEGYQEVYLASAGAPALCPRQA